MLAAAVAALEALAGRVADAGEWDAADRSAALRVLARLEGLLATSRGRLLAAERDSRALGPGESSYEAVRAREGRGGLALAVCEVRQADALASLPVVAEAVERGDLPVPHLDVVARAAATASPAVADLLASPSGQEAVVAMSRVHDAPAFARALSAWTAAHDPAAHERDHQAQRRERFLTLSDQPDGTFLRGRLDRMAGHRLRLALEATGEAPGDDRSPVQAAADALVALAERALAAPETTSGVSSRPHVSLIVPAETFAELSDRGRDLSGARPVPAPTLEDGTPVPLSELARVLCDSEISRSVMSAESVPLDLGRTVRTYGGAQRRAVIARDRVCVWPGCGRSSRWSEVHHIRWWDRDGGRTSVQNGVLLCVYHHHEVHRLDLAIERRAAPPGSGVSRAGSRGSDRPPGRAPENGDRSEVRPPGRPAVPYTFRRRDGSVVASTAEPP